MSQTINQEGVYKGLGWGLYVIFFFIIIGFLICAFGTTTNNPEVMVLIGIILPLIIFVILLIFPKQLTKEENNNYKTNVDHWMIIRIVFFILLIIFFFYIFFIEILFKFEIKPKHTAIKIGKNNIFNKYDKNNNEKISNKNDLQKDFKIDLTKKIDYEYNDNQNYIPKTNTNDINDNKKILSQYGPIKNNYNVKLPPINNNLIVHNNESHRLQSPNIKEINLEESFERDINNSINKRDLEMSVNERELDISINQDELNLSINKRDLDFN